MFRSDIVPENIVTYSSTIDQCTPFVSQTSLSSRKIVRIHTIPLNNKNDNKYNVVKIGFCFYV